jgi:hypothetical protein
MSSFLKKIESFKAGGGGSSSSIASLEKNVSMKGKGGGLGKFRNAPSELLVFVAVFIFSVSLIAIGAAGVILHNAASEDARNKVSLAYTVNTLFMGFGVGVLFGLVVDLPFIRKSAFLERGIVALLMLAIAGFGIYTATAVKSIQGATGADAKNKVYFAWAVILAFTGAAFGFFAGILFSILKGIIRESPLRFVILFTIFLGLFIVAHAGVCLWIAHHTGQTCIPLSRTGCNRNGYFIPVGFCCVGSLFIVIPIIVIIATEGAVLK